jgi:hypothetical protein
MNSIEQARFNPLYQQMQQALLLQGKRPKTLMPIHVEYVVLRIMLTAARTISPLTN